MAPAASTVTSGPNAFTVPTYSPGANAVTLILPIVAFTGTPSFAATTDVVSGTTIYDIACSGNDCQGTAAFNYTPIATDQFNFGYITTSTASAGILSTITAQNTCTLQGSSAVCDTTTVAAATDTAQMSFFGSGEAGGGTYALTSYTIPLTGATGATGAFTTGSKSGSPASISSSSSSGKASPSSNDAGKKRVGLLMGIALLVAVSVI